MNTFERIERLCRQLGLSNAYTTKDGTGASYAMQLLRRVEEHLYGGWQRGQLVSRIADCEAYVKTMPTVLMNKE